MSKSPRCRSAATNALLSAIAMCYLVAGQSAAGAQDTQPSNQGHAYTLRTRIDQIEVPVLALSMDYREMRPIAADKFFVSLNAGPPFRVTHVRNEGYDPISLAILIDLDEGEALGWELDGVIAKVSSGTLRSQDRISIYLLRHCQLLRPVSNATPDLPSLAKSLHNAMRDSQKSTSIELEPGCQKKSMLWDALAGVVGQMASLPGRRVILALSNGLDKGSQHSWNQVRTLAGTSSITIFGLQEATVYSDQFVSFDMAAESPFRTLSELTGGLVFTVTPSSLKERLIDFVDLLRRRYIVEFPRPSDLKSGEYSITVSIANTNAFIRAAGVSVPTPDPADSTDFSPDPSHAPKIGKRKVMAPPK